MKKRASRLKKSKKTTQTSISWLPIDHKLFPFIHFGEVKGIARIFLKLEITISILVVILTMLAALFKIFLIVGRMI